MVTTKPREPMREEILDFVRKTEETITEAGRKLGDTVCDLVPNDGDTIRKVVDEAFDFTEKILKSQRDFASSLLDDVLGKSSSGPTRSPKRVAPKPAARRTVHKTTKHVGAA